MSVRGSWPAIGQIWGKGVRFDARIVEKSKTWGKEGSDQGGEIVKFLRLVSNGWDGFGADGREIDRAVAFFVNLANEDAETCKKNGGAQ
jgi:hypothetical protein